MPRYARKDLVLCGAKIAKGDMVVASLVAANRDATIFPEPRTFDPNRPKDRHLAFGAGIHRCIGAPLARVELQCAVRAMVSVDAELVRDTGEDDTRWGSNVFGDVFPQEVMLRWTSRATLGRRGKNDHDK
jgi:cytochrome P450